MGSQLSECGTSLLSCQPTVAIPPNFRIGRLHGCLQPADLQVWVRTGYCRVHPTRERRIKSLTCENVARAVVDLVSPCAAIGRRMSLVVGCAWDDLGRVKQGHGGYRAGLPARVPLPPDCAGRAPGRAAASLARS